MSTPASSPSQLTSAAQVLRAASLIASFYGPGGDARNGSMEAIHRQLYLKEIERQSNLKLVDSSASLPDPTNVPNDYVSSDSRVLLRRWEPVATHDTTVIQLALNGAGQLKRVWHEMREELENMLSADLLANIRGYSLIYEAAFAPSGDVASAFKALLPHARRLYQDQPFEAPQPLAHVHMHEGDVWLVEVPLHGDASIAGTIYIALTTTQHEAKFVQTVLYGEDAALLMPDLIAHKAYFHRRHYHTGGLHRTYEAKLDYMRTTTDQLLQGLQKQVLSATEIEDLSQAYQGLARIVPQLNVLHIRQLQQMHNYAYWHERLHSNDVVNYHLTQLQASVEELKLMVAEGRDQLEATGMALELAQVRIEYARARQQERGQLLLAVLGSALAVPQLVDRMAAGELARWVGIPAPETGYSVLQLMAVQLTLIMGLAFLSIAAVWLINHIKS